MASWLSSRGVLGPSGSGPGPPSSSNTLHPSSASATAPSVVKPKKRERWLVTRKTWRYMADAGKLLIPESLRKGKDMKEYTADELSKLEEHYQTVCDQQQEFIEWEGPRQDPRVLLASNRTPKTPAPPAESSNTDYVTAKFRLVLPVGQQPPPGYVQVGKRSLPMGEVSDYEASAQQESSYVQLPSGLLLQELPAVYLTERDWYARRSSSPPDSGVLSPEDYSYDDDQFDSGQHQHASRHHHVESGIGSGADSVAAVKMRSTGIQTDPMPEEFFRLQEEERRREEEERRREEEEKKRKEEEERLAREQEEKELEAMMGDSVMRYLKMVRRNSKSSDAKKAERFRSMNYDPTLRNIKAKYLNKEENVEGFKKSMEVQVGESLLDLLKKCQTPVEPPLPKLTGNRKFSTTGSDLSDSVGSPLRRFSIGVEATSAAAIAEAEAAAAACGGSGPGVQGGTGSIGSEVERDFFAHLYSGDMAALESGAVPEDYYNYLESWYRAQKGLAPATSGAQGLSSGSRQSVVGTQASIYIPVDALQNLRASMPTLATSAAATSVSSVSRSTTSLGKSPGQSFLSSVISLRPFAGGGVTGAGSTGRIMSKKLWRSRSKSQGRSSVTAMSAWSPQAGVRWNHISNRQLTLEPTHLLMLHEFERVALQKLACQKLNSSDLGSTIRIPKDTSDKSKRRTYLLKKKVLPRWDNKDKSKDPGCGPVFGVPLGQCVETPSRKRSTTTGSDNIPLSDEAASPTTKASRSDSRTSFSSVAEALRDRGLDKMQPAGSMESLNTYELRRQSLGLSTQSALDALSFEDADAVASGTLASPCVPTVVMMCIRHLEQFGLRTVGIFRVSSSKKRVRQLREEFDRGGQITLTMDTGVHDVATLLKEFFRDLPEPLIPKDIQPALLAIHKIPNAQEKLLCLQRIMQLLPLINRDTMYVLLQFLGLVAENAEDKKETDGTVNSGNKMDTTNLATLFAPNLLHTFADDAAAAAKQYPGSPTTATADRMDHVSALRLLIEKRDQVFEVSSNELHDLYVYLHEHFPDVLDALLRRRSALAGIEIPEDVEEFVGEKGEDGGQGDTRTMEGRGRGRTRREGSEGSEGGSWFRNIREKSEQSDGGASTTENSNSRWGFKRRDRSSQRTPSSEHRKDTAAGEGVVTSEPGGVTRGSSLRFHVPKVRKASATSESIKGQSSRGTDTIIYSPASSASRGTPSSDMFFGSGNTTPSLVTSPPPNCQGGFGSPLVFSPPISPPPLQQATVVTTSVINAKPRLSVAIGLESKSPPPLVLSPVPPSKTADKAKRSSFALNVDTGTPKRTVVTTTSTNTTTFSTTLLSVSGQRIPGKSKTDDLERYISEIEASEAAAANQPTSASAGATPTKEHKKYTRRRYTDTRHPTTELPDVRSDADAAATANKEVSVQRPPVRRKPQPV